VAIRKRNKRERRKVARAERNAGKNVSAKDIALEGARAGILRISNFKSQVSKEFLCELCALAVKLFIHSLHIFSGSGVNFENISGLNEKRDFDGLSGLQGGVLAGA